MTTAQLYRKHKAGEISRDRFLYEVRRDSNLPWVTNTTSFDDAVKILKNKSIISEMDANVKTDPAVDRVNPYFLKRGVNKLLSKEDELTNDSYIDALNKAAKQLEKNPHAFDEEMFANAESVQKEDEKLEMEEVKKGNLNDKKNEMKKVKVKPAKSLKEAAIEELTNSLKKKESINEDSHWYHHVGSEVHTPDGEGTVKEITGGTLTVELKDGQLKDYQINTIDHHNEKAQEEATMPFQDAPLDPSYKMNKDGQRAISPEGIEFKVGDKVTSIQNEKETGTISGFKQEQGRIKALVNKGMFVTSYDIAGLKKDESTNPWDKFKGRMIPEAIKKYIAKHKDDKEKMGKLKDMVKKIKEATKFHAGGEVIFTKDSEAPGYEADLKRAGVKYTKEKVA
jgi:hypothetical protein